MRMFSPISALALVLGVAATSAQALNEKKATEAFLNFLDNYISPNNTKVAQSINSTLFAEDCLGTIDVSTNFDGRELSTEYLFGLFVNIEKDKNVPSAIGVPLSYKVSHLMVQNNYVFASTKFDYFYPTLNMHFPVQIDSWMLFNEAAQIQYYDISFRRWAWATDTVAPMLVPQMAAYAKVQSTDPVKILTEFYLPIICSTAETQCTGENKQYDSYEACAAFIRSIPLGQFYRLGENNILCRSLHVPMLSFRPSVHCPHIGPSGGGMCSDRNYNQVVTDNHFPQGFIANKWGQRLTNY